MTRHERGILDAVRRARADGLEPKSLYLSPDYLEALGLADDVAELGGIPLKRAARRTMLYCRHGIQRTVTPARTGTGAAGGFTPGQRLLLVSLLQEWPLPLSKTIEAALRRDGLVARRTKPRRYKGRTHAIEEARLTGRGEEEAKRLWDSLGRDERAQLRAQAMRSGL